MHTIATYVKLREFLHLVVIHRIPNNTSDLWLRALPHNFDFIKDYDPIVAFIGLFDPGNRNTVKINPVQGSKK